MMLAYIDMGTGSYVIQLLIAGVAGVSYACRHAISRSFVWLKSKLNRRRPPSAPDRHV